MSIDCGAERRSPLEPLIRAELNISRVSVVQMDTPLTPTDPGLAALLVGRRTLFAEGTPLENAKRGVKRPPTPIARSRPLCPAHADGNCPIGCQGLHRRDQAKSSCWKRFCTGTLTPSQFPLLAAADGSKSPSTTGAAACATRSPMHTFPLHGDMIQTVLAFLDPKSLARVCQTSKWLRRLALHNRVWAPHTLGLLVPHPMIFLQGGYEANNTEYYRYKWHMRHVYMQSTNATLPSADFSGRPARLPPPAIESGLRLALIADELDSTVSRMTPRRRRGCTRARRRRRIALSAAEARNQRARRYINSLNDLTLMGYIGFEET